MHIMRPLGARILALALLLAGSGGQATAAVVNINWLQMPPTPFGSSVPNASVFFAPGIGNVTVTHSIGALVHHQRGQSPTFTVGSVNFGPNTYQWSNFEYFGTILTAGPDPLAPVVSTVTYTFPALLSPRTVYLGTIRLGSTTSFGGGSSVITVNQNGTFFGDFNGGAYGPSLFTGGAGTFNVRNSLSAPGGIDPHWNSQLGVVRIDDPVSSLTIIHSGIRGDGIGAHVGFVPDLATAAPTTTWGRLKKLYR